MHSLTETRTGGDPDDEGIVFTDLTPTRLEDELAKLGTPACDDTIRDWLEDHNLRLRKIAKSRAGGSSPDRDEQFLHIADLIEQRESSGQPFFFIDSKAKEHMGRLFRKGRSRCSRPYVAFDHDFPSWAEGVLIPHGI